MRSLRRACFACLGLVPAFALGSGCAGLVGITDIPDGATEPLYDGGGIPPFDGVAVGSDAPRHQDGHTPGVDGFIIPPNEGGSTDDGSPDGVASGGGDAGFPYPASNIAGMTFQADVTGPLNLVGDNCVIFTDWPDPQSISCENSNPPMDIFSVNMPDGAGIAVIYVFTYISIDDQTTVSVHGTNPLILIALDSVDIRGSIDVSADVYDSDSDINTIPGSRGSGSGVGGFNNGGPQGGGGGSFCGAGGTGAMGSGATASESAPGQTYGNATIIPLFGGSAGGGASAGGADGLTSGYGGGVIQISAGNTITLETGAYITASGSGGISQGDESGEGAGSGGAILLEAPTVTIAGVLVANGGEGSDNNMDGENPPDDGGVAEEPSCAGGNGSAGAVATGSNGSSTGGGYGGGGGGAGWIRINGTTVSVTGTISPSTASGCASQGPLP